MKKMKIKTNESETRKMNVPAETTYKQIGGQAFAMMGASHFYKTDEGNTLVFKIKGCRKINFIEVIYDGGSDLYNLNFKKWGLKKPFVTLVENCDGIYADQLHEIIEDKTGLYLSL